MAMVAEAGTLAVKLEAVEILVNFAALGAPMDTGLDLQQNIRTTLRCPISHIPAGHSKGTVDANHQRWQRQARTDTTRHMTVGE
jgi:hypothetical protein